MTNTVHTDPLSKDDAIVFADALSVIDGYTDYNAPVSDRTKVRAEIAAQTLTQLLVSLEVQDESANAAQLLKHEIGG